MTSHHSPNPAKRVNLKCTVSLSQTGYLTQTLEYVDGQIVPIDSLKDLKPEPKAVKQVPKPATNNSPLRNPDFTAFPDQPQSKLSFLKPYQKNPSTPKSVSRNR